jgi:hypothetical protein
MINNKHLCDGNTISVYSKPSYKTMDPALTMTKQTLLYRGKCNKTTVRLATSCEKSAPDMHQAKFCYFKAEQSKLGSQACKNNGLISYSEPRI